MGNKIATLEMLKFILATLILVSFSIEAFEIDDEDGNLVDYFVDDLPVREVEVDQDEDQFVPEKIARAATWKLRGGKRADDLYKRESLWKLRTGKRALWKLRGGKRSGT